MPGVISDSLPDRYGKTYFKQYYKQEYGVFPTALEQLLFLGEHAMGGLVFKPSMIKEDERAEKILEIRELYELSKKVEQEKLDYTISSAIALSNSAAGGAKRKAIVRFDPETHKVCLGDKHGELPKGYVYCMIKFDETESRKYPFIDKPDDELSVPNKLEYVYSLCAKKCGINMTRTWLVEDEIGFHFATERFDRRDKKRLHMHSFAGMHHNDASPQSMSYEMLFKTAEFLNTSHESKNQIFKVMVFNLVFGNRDDHAKNFSFLMDNQGEWEFSPAYDITFSTHEGVQPWHQLTIGNMASNIKAKVIMEIANKFKIEAPKEIITDIIHCFKEELLLVMQGNNISSKIYKEIEATTKKQVALLEEVLDEK